MTNSSTHTLPNAALPTSDADSQRVLQNHIEHLQVALEHELRHAADGLSEHALIKRLQKPPWLLVGALRFDCPEQLYPVHFLLLHSLYSLRDQLAEGGESLTISPLLIRLESNLLGSVQGPPDVTDALRAYYLDLNQYRLSADQIHTMLNDFYAGHYGAATRPDDTEIAAAAACLGYGDSSLPAEFIEVKQRFRRAVMQAHPDRGGTTAQIQQLNAAFGIIRKHYRAR